MKAARLHEYGKPLSIDDVPIPEIKEDEVLIRVIASYVCSSDLALIGGKHRSPNNSLPLIPGHNNTGYVEAVGSNVTGFTKGEPVAVYGGWGCGHCHFCLQGEEQLCDMRKWVGFGVDGGYAQYLRVPAVRHLIKLEQLDPFEVSPLLDAGLTPYRAVKKMLPYLYPGAVSVIIGIGNIGYFAVQIAKALSPGAKVVAIDIDRERLELASQAGADNVLDSRSDVSEQFKKLSNGQGAQAVIDTVGSNDTLAIAAVIAAKGSSIIRVGLAGGTIPRLPMECSFTTSLWGTYNELEELLSLYGAGKIRCQIERFPLEHINEVFHLMEGKQIQGQAVITP